MLFVSREVLTQGTYNIAAISFTPEQIAESVKKARLRERRG